MEATTGILIAMSVEYERVAAMLSETSAHKFGPHEYLTGTVNGKRIVMMQCGIGKVNASSGVTDMILHFHPDRIISTGVAGGIDTSLNVMDVVVSEENCYHDVYCGEGLAPGQVQGLPPSFKSDESLVHTAMSLQSPAHILKGLICTGERFITNRAEVDSIKSRFPSGLAVDMESAAIAHVCYLYGVPFVSFRIISDTPREEEGHHEQYLNFWDVLADKSFSTIKLFIESI